MPKPKKIAPKDPKQPKLILTRSTPPITRMISQYGMLSELCKYISSADFVHLAATSKEHHKYIASNSTLFKTFIGAGPCDSSGLMAQHKIFGHPHPDRLMGNFGGCHGYDAKPCVDCGAKVCNVCRFHIFYEETCNDEGAGGWDEVEASMCTLIANNSDLLETWHRVGIELKKVVSILYTQERNQVFCLSCHPLILPHEIAKDRCQCTAYGRFIEPWRCIPCFTVLETELIRAIQKVRVTYSRERKAFDEVTICDCGQDAHEKSAYVCRVCGGANGWFPPLEPMIRARIRAQLGGDVPSSSDNVLSQLA